MLPSTGYFKGINCPFYDSGLCERPYCHFRHVKKESQNTSNEGIESGAILQKLVSAAVQKVLQQTDVSGTVISQNTVADSLVDINKINNNPPNVKATYNPTPISELNKINNTDAETNDESNEQRKRHIPVPYTPRKPANLIIKRPVEDDGYSKPFVYNPPALKYTPGSAESVKPDQYTPKGSSEECNKYLPGSEAELEKYKPTETQSSNKFNYIPSDKNFSKKKLLEYKPTKVTPRSEAPSVTYQPTPRSLAPCFSSDEDEEKPDIKKRKLSSDLNGLDDLGPEFDILDQILDEEKSSFKTESKTRKERKTSTDGLSKDHIHNIKDHNVSSTQEIEKAKVEKIASKRSHREKSNKKDKSLLHGNKHSKSKSSEKTSSRKNSSNATDKDKEHKLDKNKDKNKRHSTSSNSSKRSSNCEKSKQYEKESRHLNSKEDSEKKNKNDHRKSHRSSKRSKDKQKKMKKDSCISDLTDKSNCNDVAETQHEELLDISESDEENIELQCKKIFEEYVPTAKPTNLQEAANKTDDIINENEYIPTKKRVSRTIDKNLKVIPKAPLKQDFKGNAAQTMAERLAKVREFHATKKLLNHSNLENTASKSESLRSSFSAPSIGSSKIRIAHVPYASTLLNAKKIISPSPNMVKSEPSTSTTIIQTVKKGAQRIAHLPNDNFIDRPGVLEPLASKIPANIRSTYLNMMIDVCIKIYLSAIDAYARAQHEELTTSKKCSTVQIYKNSAVLAISRLKKELQECNGVKKAGTDCTTLQKNPQSLSGKTNNAGSWSIENKGKRNIDNSQFSGEKLYNNIKKWILTEQQLHDNGFPRPHPCGEKGRAIIYGQKKQNPPKGYVRTCCRCKKDYTVDKKGFAAIKEECIYHPNNKYRVRGEVRYQCCSQDGTSDGCCIAPSHVYEYIDFENLKGFVRTLPPESQMDDYGVYSLDCEMCYTTRGLDLTRITVINSSCRVVYETLIKPLHPIIDYNTRYSGITENQMVDVKTSLLEVQATLLAMFNNKTILIGHSLESDFKALKLIHDTVIDTSVLFPHKMGPPYKRALKNLSSEHLKKIIQNSVDGHDSAEDATVCMELIHYKLKEDLKTR